MLCLIFLPMKRFADGMLVISDIESTTFLKPICETDNIRQSLW